MNNYQSYRKIEHSSTENAFSMGRAWLELDMNNLRHNLNVLLQLIPENCQLMPVIKANAYGHGAVEITRELNACGIQAFCVASVLEGVELRKNGIMGEILILGYTHPKQLYLLEEYNLTQTVVDCCYARVLDNYGNKLTVHIKVDTGMRRLGERSENIDGIMQIFEYKNLIITGIYTQLCVSDSDRLDHKSFTQNQISKFYSVLSKIEEHGLEVPKKHIQSSYGLFNYHELALDYIRVGISLYGMFYSSEDSKKHGSLLRPVLSVRSRISAVKMLFAGESIGYGLAFTAQYDMKVAVLTIGYADGIPRCLSCGVGNVLVNGQKAPVVGRICMDQMMVDITGIENVQQGDIAVIIGKSGNVEITACEIADQAGTVSAEILSRLGSRLEKIINYTHMQTDVPARCVKLLQSFGTGR